MKNLKTKIGELLRLAGWQNYWLIYIAVLTVLPSGLWIARQSGVATDLQMRRELVRQTINVAATVNPARIRSLSFTADDKNRPEFQHLCSQMRAYADVTGIKSLYTMALRNGQIVFGPESLPEGHPYASPPGTVYQEPSLDDFDLFKTGRPQIQGPFSDEYGDFVTASAPVFNPCTGEVLAAVGIDVESAVWRAAVRRAQWIPALITLVLLLILLLSGQVLKHRKQVSPQRHKRITHAEPVLCIVFMILLTLALALWFDRADRESRRNAFYSLAQTQADICAGEFDHLNSQLKQLVCFFESSQGISREEFETYCKEMITDGLVEACVWLPEVPEAEASTFIQNVRATGRPGFSIWQKNEHSVNEPVEPRSVYYPALYIEPLTGHETALGYDLNSEPARRVAIQETLRTGRATATDSGKLITLTNQPPGFVIFQRVNTPVLKGLAAFALRPENLLGGAQHQTRKNPGLKVCLFQLREGAEPLFMAGSSGECGLSCFRDVEAGLNLTVPVFRFGKAYALNLIADESWLEANPLHAARNVMGIGLLTALLFSFVVFMATNRRQVLEKLVERSTAELLASEAAMRESQQLIEGIINTIPVRVFWKDKNLVFLGCNAAFARDAGFTAPQDLIGKDDYQMGWREQAARYRADDCQVIESGRPKLMIEEPQTTPDGKTITLLTSKIPLRDADGKICGILGTYFDISDRKRAERLLVESEARYRAILKASPDDITVTDMEGRVLLVSPVTLTMFRCRREEELLGHSAADFIVPEDRARALSNIALMIQGNKTGPGEYRARRMDESVFDIEVNGEFIRDAEGQPFQMVLIARDITERKQMELYREVEREILEKLNESLSLHNSITCVLGVIKEKIGVDAVGMRMQKGDDFPYFVQEGFSADFLSTENTLIERGAAEGGVCRDKDGNVSLECTCGLVLSGKTDPSNPLFTNGGSFWTNDSFPLLDIFPDQDPRHRPRNVCMHHGYASMALIPIRTGDQIVGLLQLNDRRKGRFSLAGIEKLESVAAHIGEALMRKNAEEELQQTQRSLLNLMEDVRLENDARRQAEKRIRQLAQHLEGIREKEQKRISRELHDDIGQTLTALKIDLVMLKDECSCQGSVKDRMGDMQKLLRDGIQSVHSLCSRLRPSALDDIGLAEALSGLAGDWKQRNHLECNFCADLDGEVFSDDIRTTVFRMVQEALTNVSRYAKASKVDIHLVADKQTLHISVADNGCGMEAAAADKSSSFGLLGMRERFELLSGTLHIESEPGKGTRIDGSIPLSVGWGGR